MTDVPGFEPEELQSMMNSEHDGYRDGYAIMGEIAPKGNIHLCSDEEDEMWREVYTKSKRNPANFVEGNPAELVEGMDFYNQEFESAEDRRKAGEIFATGIFDYAREFIEAMGSMSYTVYDGEKAEDDIQRGDIEDPSAACFIIDQYLRTLDEDYEDLATGISNGGLKLEGLYEAGRAV